MPAITVLPGFEAPNAPSGTPGAPAGTTQNFFVGFAGFTDRQVVTLEVYEVNDEAERSIQAGVPEVLLARLAGRMYQIDAQGLTAFRPDAPHAATVGSTINVQFHFVSAAARAKDAPANPRGLLPSPLAGGWALYLNLEALGDRYAQHEGDAFEVEIRAKVGGAVVARSGVVRVARVRRAVPVDGEKRATYHWHAGNTVKLYNDAAEGPDGAAGAWADLYAAIGKAEHFIFVVDWTFHPLTRINRAGARLADTAGGMLIQRAKEKPDLVVAIHTWNHAEEVADYQNDEGGKLLAAIGRALDAGESVMRRVKWRASSRTGALTGALMSHHQKFVVMDQPDAASGRKQVVAFFGGLDLTKGRFDCRDHPLFPGDDSQWLTQVVLTPEDGALLASLHRWDDWYSGEFFGEQHLRSVADGARRFYLRTRNQAEYTAALAKRPPDPAPPARAVFRGLGHATIAKVMATLGDSQADADEALEDEAEMLGKVLDGANDLRLPREPWHDIHAQITGPTAWDIAREFVGRWNLDGVIRQALIDPQSAEDAMGPWLRITRRGGTVKLPPNAALEPCNLEPVLKVMAKLHDKTVFVGQHERHGGGRLNVGAWTGQVLRSLESTHWGPSGFQKNQVKDGKLPRVLEKEFVWTVSGGYERSIQDSYLQAISQADKHIYIETQFLIGSGKHWFGPNGSGTYLYQMHFGGSGWRWLVGKEKPIPSEHTPGTNVDNAVPEAIVNRTIDRIDKGLPFHTYVVVPLYSEGDPVSIGIVPQRHYECLTILYMIKAIDRAAKAKGKSWRDYLSFFCLGQWTPGVRPKRAMGLDVRMLEKAGDYPKSWTAARARFCAESKRYMVYVHSKLMVVDDRYLILGSANLNERSTNGARDSEICVALWPNANAQDEETVSGAIAELRTRLWREHFGASAPMGAPEAADTARTANVIAESNYHQFWLGTPGAPMGGHAVALNPLYDDLYKQTQKYTKPYELWDALLAGWANRLKYFLPDTPWAIGDDTYFARYAEVYRPWCWLPPDRGPSWKGRIAAGVITQ